MTTFLPRFTRYFLTACMTPAAVVGAVFALCAAGFILGMEAAAKVAGWAD